MKQLRLIILLLAATLTAHSQGYRELSDTKPRDAESAWKSLPKGVNFVWGNTDSRYPKFSIPTKSGMENKDGNQRQIALRAWRGERVNAQAVIYTRVDLQDVTIAVSDFKKGKKRISATSVRIQPVGYVMTDELNKNGKGGCGHRPDPTAFDSTLVADVLNNQNEPFAVSANSTRPVWFTIAVPENAEPGSYSGKVTLSAKGGKPQSIEIKLHVLEHVLPQPAAWSFHLDLWQNPYAVARYHSVPLWSDAHFELMKPLMKMLADAGQKIITTTIMQHPWNGQTYDAFDSMIGKQKGLDGKWTYNYDVFDKWVSFMMNDVGITEQINCYTIIPWALRFDYYDVASNSIRFITAKPGSAAYRDYWLPFLTDFAGHLKAKGWFEKTTIAMDERSLEDMQRAIQVIKEADSAFKITLAGNYHAEIEKDIYDYCIAFGQDFPADVKSERERLKKPSTVYTCCTEAFPNTFTFSPPAEAVWIGWHTAAKNYDGYLRWAYNSWTESPLQDSRFRSWAAGDCYLVYPDARSSIRFERLIEGIQDVEKIKLLRKKYAGNERKIKALTEILNTFESVPENPKNTVSQQVRKAKELLNSID